MAVPGRVPGAGVPALVPLVAGTGRGSPVKTASGPPREKPNAVEKKSRRSQKTYWRQYNLPLENFFPVQIRSIRSPFPYAS